MTVREYLSQGPLLEQRIACSLRKKEAARALAASISVPCPDGIRISSSRAREASFVRVLERVDVMERQIAAELELLLALREQMERVIRSVPGEEKYRLVLTCRYLEHKTWLETAGVLGITRNTVHVWHEAALARAVLPEDAIDIRRSPPHEG